MDEFGVDLVPEQESKIEDDEIPSDKLPEEWKSVPSQYGFSNYEASNYGRIRNKRTGKFLYGCKNDAGYIVGQLVKDNGKGTMIQHHRVIAMAFHTKPDGKDIVDHINRDKGDNRPCNLRWVDHAENRENASKVVRKGKSFPVEQYKDDVIIKKWESAKEAAESLSLSASDITCAIRDATELKGFTWKRSELSIPGETWVSITINEEVVTVSNKGRVKLKTLVTYGSEGNNGYLHVLAGGKRRLVHRLIGLAFLGDPPQGKDTINHIDKNKHNNCVENLEWSSMQEQITHRGRSNKNTASLGRPVAMMHPVFDDVVLAIYPTATAAVKAHKLNNGNLGKAITRKNAKGEARLCGGYRWQYIDPANPPKIHTIEDLM